ncbi:YitT family protein [Thalassospira sp. GB04J01]|uniref:YitT family protein n=1 Tax=Thalassospira sp. GB04J01 TaxID=1485225 RepID=UPI003265C5DA
MFRTCEHRTLITIHQTKDSSQIMTKPTAHTANSDAPKKDDISHRLYEDVLALLLGTMVVSLGVTLYSESVLVTGSTAGAALLIEHATGFSFGVIFFVINLPFYWLAYKRMGKAFTLKTFVAVGLVSIFSKLTPMMVDFTMLNPIYAAVAGGALMGIGLLMLFRHRAGLGGINILALYLQEHFGIRAGYVQLAIDMIILIIAFLTLPFDKVLLSILGAVVLNLIIAINHRPGRYLAAR